MKKRNDFALEELTWTCGCGQPMREELYTNRYFTLSCSKCGPIVEVKIKIKPTEKP